MKGEEEEKTTFEQSQIDQAKRIMKPFVLRRLKCDVLNSLPKKSETSVRRFFSQTIFALKTLIVAKFRSDQSTFNSRTKGHVHGNGSVIFK